MPKNSHAGSQLELMKLVLTKSNLETTRFFISRKKGAASLEQVCYFSNTCTS